MASTESSRSLNSLDTGQSSFIYWLLRINKGLQPIKAYQYVGIYLLTCIIIYGIGFVWAAGSNPSLLIKFPGLKGSYLNDVNLMFIVFITLPVSLCLHLQERNFIPSCLERLTTNGVLCEPKISLNQFIVLWEKRFKISNWVIQFLGVIIVLIVIKLNYKSMVDDPTGWQHYGAPKDNITYLGWFNIIFQISLVFFIISQVLLRIPIVTWLLWSLRNSFTIKVRPLHPDGVGGLEAVARIALQGQLVLAMLGINIASIIMSYYFHDNSQPWYIVTAGVIAYVIIAPIVFLGPLLPFRKPMKREKEKLLSSISSEFDQELNDIGNLLQSSDSIKRLEKIEKITRLNKSISRFPEWPSDMSTLRKFFVTLLVPAISALISTIVELIIKGIK